MPFFGSKPHETSATLYSYEVVEENSAQGDDSPQQEAIPYDPRCAWCGGPGDEHGSHSICSGHQAQVLQQAAARRRSRGRP